MRWEKNINFEVGLNCSHFPKWCNMVQYGAKTNHLEHLGDHGPEMIQNCTKTDHMEHVGGHGPEMIRNGTQTNTLELLNDL